MTAPKMNPKVKAMWIKALRSGEYVQGNGRLRKENKLGETRFCCLGVLCNLHAQKHPKFAATQTNPSQYDGEMAIPSKRVLKWAGITSGIVDIGLYSNTIASHLWERNDGYGFPMHTFCEIADFIEVNL